MAAYNGSAYIKQQLDSFVSQTRLPDELIVCDDFSCDATIEILERFVLTAPFKVILVFNAKNLGYTKNFEKVLSLCSGDLIFLSDQDDVWYENKISKILEVKREHPDSEVIINDAMYVDESLKPSGVTVLQKVLSFSGREDAHIAGASTAITKIFRDFILPFPENNCPAHDVYIHRWANLLKNKVVVPNILQCWRIHGKNNSVSEMNNATAVSHFQLYDKYKNVNVSSEYIKKANEFREMDSLVCVRKEGLFLLSPRINVERLRRKIKNIISAHTIRSDINQAKGFERMKLIFSMVINGHYKHFQGTKSVVKDILR